MNPEGLELDGAAIGECIDQGLDIATDAGRLRTRQGSGVQRDTKRAACVRQRRRFRRSYRLESVPKALRERGGLGIARSPPQDR